MYLLDELVKEKTHLTHKNLLDTSLLEKDGNRIKQDLQVSSLAIQWS